MGYDEELATRVREATAGTAGITERAMFGGLAFLRGGNMAVGVSGAGGLMVRVEPGLGEELVATTEASPMEMGSRSMTGWLRIPTEAVATDAALERWVGIGLDRAGSLPAK